MVLKSARFRLIFICDQYEIIFNASCEKWRIDFRRDAGEGKNDVYRVCEVAKRGEKAEAGSSGSRNNDVSSVGTSFQLVRPDCQLVVSRLGKESKVDFSRTYVRTRPRVSAAAEV